MAKKGGVQQLQIEVNTDEELSKFMDKDGLLIMDVYTEWCGPCLAMIGSLKKIKLEKGGDDLQLAVVKCDNIEVFKRFRNKCEPTWLFVSKRKIVNCAFGSNVPKLMSMITTELDIERKCRDGQAERVYYELTEMCSVELERYNAKKAREEEIDQIEKEAAEAKRRAYIVFVTDEIIKHGGDMGVTIHMPHLISRDLFKRMTEQGDKFGLQAKDKKTSLINDEDLEVLHFEIENPMPAYVLKLLKKKEAFMICWKTGELEERSITEILTEMTQLLAEDQPILDEHGNVNPDLKKPAILKSQSIVLTDDEIKELGMKVSDENVINCEISEEGDEENEVKTNQNDELDQDSKNEEEPDDSSKSGEVKIEVELDESGLKNQNGDEKEENQNDLGGNDGIENEDQSEEKSIVDPESNVETTNEVLNETKVEIEPDNQSKLKETMETKQKQLLRPVSGHKFKIPPMWSPGNPRANAAFVYIFFRHIPQISNFFDKALRVLVNYWNLGFNELTESFLAPDPIPVPPHVLVCFDAYKRKEIMDLIEQHADAVLAYGYFTSDDLTTTTLIANSTFKYNLETPTIHDKLFVKLAKRVGTAMASFMEMSPCHVSETTELGYEECLLLFPTGYKNASETGVEPKEPEEEIESKKKKRKKNKKNKEEGKEEETIEVAEEGVDEDGDDDDEDDESELEEDNVDESND